MVKHLEPAPYCFGEYPTASPQTRAEHCCHDCPFQGECAKVEGWVHDPFINFKNPNGTYNGAAFMSMMTGIPEDEIRKTFQYKVLEKMENARKEDRKSGM